jgi:hypothetical protein
MGRGSPAVKLAITVAKDVHTEVLRAATAEHVSISAWMTRAARRALQIQDGLVAVAEWEADQGAFSAQELAAARARVGAGSTRTSGRRRARTR